jgi:hypothetical protein
MPVSDHIAALLLGYLAPLGKPIAVAMAFLRIIGLYILPLIVVAVLGGIHLPYPFAGDQALFLLGAGALERGEVLYVDFWDIKQPGIYLFFWLAGHLFGFSEIGVHFLELVWQGLFTIVLIATLRPYYEIPWLSSLVPLATIGPYYCSAAGHLLTQVEILVPLPLFLCLWLTCYPWETVRASKLAYFASGCCAATVAVFKLILLPIPVSFWVASAVWAIYRTNHTIGIVLLERLPPFVIGAAGVFAVLTIWFASNGALPDFLWTNFRYPVEAVATTTDIRDWERLLFSAGWFTSIFAPWLPFTFLGMTIRRGDRRDLMTIQLVLWLVIGTALIVAQRLSWWSYHFLLLIVQAGVLAIRGIDVVARVLSRDGKAEHRSMALIAAMLVYSASAAGLQSLFTKVQPLVDLVWLGKTNLVGYRGWVEPEYYRIWENTRFLVEPGALPGPTYVFGNPNYYLLAGRTQAIPIHGWAVYLLPWQRERQAEQLAASRPPYIFTGPQVDQLTFDRTPKLKDWIDQNYVPLRKNNEGTWYQLTTTADTSGSSYR